VGKKNKKATERRRQKNLEKKKKRRANPGVRRRKGRGRKLPSFSEFVEMVSEMGGGTEKKPLEGTSVHIENPGETAVPVEDLENQEPIVVGPGPEADASTIQEALDLLSMNVAQLRKTASELGLKGYSKMKKAELIEACKEAHGS
jgi:hypothetical protein